MIVKPINIVLLLAVIFRVAAYLTNKYVFLFGGADANDYHEYAQGLHQRAYNVWPVILAWLNSVGLYSRDLISFGLLIISLTLLPYIYSKIVGNGKEVYNFRAHKEAFILILLYPTITVFTFDIYRDIIIYLLFVSTIYVIRKYYSATYGLHHLAIFIICAYICYHFRGYLGYSLILAFLITFICEKIRLSLWAFLIVYILALFVAYEFDILRPILEYRTEDGFDKGASSFHIGLMNKGPVEFIKLYFISFIFQMTGLYLNSPKAVLVFALESIPFIMASIYVIKNWHYADLFCKYLLVFFTVYTSIFVLGNDNLGTAVRIRVPSYLSIFACYFIIRQYKTTIQNNSSLVHKKTSEGKA